MEYHVDTIKLKKKIIECGFDTNIRLSEATGINRTTLGHILSGKQLPSSSAMYKLAEVLLMSGTEAGDIFFANNLRSM